LAAGLHARNCWRLPVLLVCIVFAHVRRTVTTWRRDVAETGRDSSSGIARLPVCACAGSSLQASCKTISAQHPKLHRHPPRRNDRAIANSLQLVGMSSVRPHLVFVQDGRRQRGALVEPFLEAPISFAVATRGAGSPSRTSSSWDPAATTNWSSVTRKSRSDPTSPETAILCATVAACHLK
jgi:hypothetical protein